MKSLFARNDIPTTAALFVLCMLLVWLVSAASNPPLATDALVSALLAALAAAGLTSSPQVHVARLDTGRHA